MYIDGLTFTALVLFFVVAAAVLYRWLMNICGKLGDCRRDHEQAPSQEGRS